ncbi:serine/threonine-protein kinase [Lentisphaera profundi]|uniref:mitogen-activated protein kinase kinase n=1 Tax=Lentisphaera profundi TaxID=1658616 RepID=A0ABY7VZE6_9BACT|nr:serine/threonine-protein kinase [Lentisphaera profundi]WDE98156.1 serine/threonine-protein kinase [Lentisphaera profundi]
MKDWKIVRLLGQGSMGEVYQVENKAHQQGAMKVVLKNCIDEQETHYLQEEAKILLKLRHKNIVHVLEAGFDDFQYFFVQELVVGRNVDSTLKKYGSFKAHDAMRICRDVALALDYLWREEKVIHRDIKPENIMLSREGAVKLMDLGVGLTHEQVKTEGYGAGTPYYMSPEMIQKPSTCDFRTDIYSLGISLIEMIQGEKPYVATKRNDVFDKILKEDVNLSRLNCGSESQDIIGKLIHRDANKRPSSWQETILLLEKMIHLESQASPLGQRDQVYNLGQDKAFTSQYILTLIGFFALLIILIYTFL